MIFSEAAADPGRELMHAAESALVQRTSHAAARSPNIERFPTAFGIAALNVMRGD
jgi:hypothetical protein